MMAGPSGTTPVLALPYPIPDDSVDVPRDILALATKLDGYSSLRPPATGALPGSPVDGQEIYLQPPGQPWHWHLRYNATAGKWMHLGGGPKLYAVYIGDKQATAASGWTTTGVKITLPFKGLWNVEWGAGYGQAPNINQFYRLGVGLAGAAPVPANGVTLEYTAAGTAGGVYPLGQRSLQITTTSAPIDAELSLYTVAGLPYVGSPFIQAWPTTVDP